MENFLSAFHFLRPWWLLAAPAIALIWWRGRRPRRSRSIDDTMIAPHLRDALTVNRDAQGRFGPNEVFAAAMLCLAIAASGPTWSRIPSPWFAETAPLVIAFEISDSMRSNDLQPTRLERARFKIMDLIARRTGARTALLAYAGTAHVVMPPSTDAEVLKPFLESLDPAMMPVPGANAAAVLAPARQLLGEESAYGTLLFVTDGFNATDLEALAQFAAEPGAPRMVALIVGTPEGGLALLPDGTPATERGGARIDTRVDEDLIRRVAQAAGMVTVMAEPGDGDLNRVLRQIQSNLAQADDPDARWRDEGPRFLWPAALLVLVSFRRGWVMVQPS